ncbi:MAG: dihydroorotate dehydrogenase electron transfer subunit [Candidatus Jacksonbacteria bacterium]|nr:dihydroorotate dehydrogenase electron transfer subunit [Candidatus Jacksonbacteria bacterium]
MKHLAKGIIKGRVKLSENYFSLELECLEIARDARPGQFIMIECKGKAFLKRPMGLSSADPKNGVIEFIYQVCGAGTRALHERNLGETLELIGPLGNSFWIEKNARVLGLVAGGTGIGPLLMLAKSLHETSPSVEIIGFIGGKNAGIVCGINKMMECAREVRVTTDDGSVGAKGFVTDALIEFLKINTLDSIIACGPTPMMKKTAEVARERKIPCQVSLEEHMACGFGACMGCPFETNDGEYEMICSKGPIFDANKIKWKE